MQTDLGEVDGQFGQIGGQFALSEVEAVDVLQHDDAHAIQDNERGAEEAGGA